MANYLVIRVDELPAVDQPSQANILRVVTAGADSPAEQALAVQQAAARFGDVPGRRFVYGVTLQAGVTRYTSLASTPAYTVT